jgi:hypothetical protein
LVQERLEAAGQYPEAAVAVVLAGEAVGLAPLLQGQGKEVFMAEGLEERKPGVIPPILALTAQFA